MIGVQAARVGASDLTHHGLATLDVAVSTSFDDRSLSRRAWDEAVTRLGGSVYMTWDWLLTWWSFYGKSRPLRLYVFAADSQIVGLLPVYIDQLGRGPFRLRIARLVGANVPPKVFDPPLSPLWAATCLSHVLDRSITVDRCDVISLGPVSATIEAWQSLDKVLNGTRSGARVERATVAVHSLFRLPLSQPEYLKSLSKNEQKNRRKYELRTLRKKYKVETTVISGPTETLLAEFDRFAELHRKQWQAEGKPGHFGAWPDALEYNRSLVGALGALDRVRFVRITANGTLISSQYVFSFGGRWYWELPARLPGRDWDCFSLGPSGIVTMIGEAIGAGVNWIQGGLGHYEYKLRLGAEEHHVYTFRIRSQSVSARFRNTAFTLLRHAIRLCYHSLWYRRLMPWAPAPLKRPQWEFWLRTDF